jgi:hypothetical protein
MLTFNVRSGQYTRDEMAMLISSRQWFHSFKFENGLTTPASDPREYLVEVLGLSNIVKGRAAIDFMAAGEPGSTARLESYKKGANARKPRNGRAIIYAHL